MERKEFIRTGILAFGAASLAPTVMYPLNLFPGSNAKLKVNHHIRHGYYGKEFMVNDLGLNFAKNIRIDRFENPEGDMILLEIITEESIERFALQGNEFIYEIEGQVKNLNIKNLSETMRLCGGRIEVTPASTATSKMNHFLFIPNDDKEEIRLFHSTYAGTSDLVSGLMIYIS